MTNFTKQEHTVRWVATENLSVVWATAQRGMDNRKVAQIAENLDPDFFGVITVTLPVGEGGVHHVIDGQHRVAAIRQAWGDGQKVPCMVLNVDDPKRAADIFSQINGKRSRPQAIDLFRVGVTAGYEAEVAVNKLVTGLGYHVGFDSTDGSISAVAMCLSIYRRHGIARLRDTLTVIQGTFGKSRESVDAAVLNGYTRFLVTYGTQIDRQRLVDRVAKQYTPGRLIGAARNWRDMKRISVADGIARVLLDTYNHGLKRDRLEESSISRKALNGTGKAVKHRPGPAFDAHGGIGIH